MFARDAAAHSLAMVIEEVGPGFARLAMTVTPAMLNGHDYAHGGFIFTLADTAFAYACNSYDRATVGQNATISYVAPGRAGQRLTAVARERHRTGRTGVYDVEVTGESGETLALFRGTSYEIGGPIIEKLLLDDGGGERSGL